MGSWRDGDRQTFLNYNIAIAALFGVDLPPGQSFDGRSNLYREQDLTGRIAGVHIYPADIRVDLDGEGLDGCELELAGNRPGPVIRISANGPQTVSLPIPEGLPPNTWIVLRSGGQWLDRRFLSYPYATGEADDVDYWVESSSRLENLVSAGEGPMTEFKQIIPEERIRLMKTVAAFSNGSGGTVLIGVANDGTIVGADADLTSPGGNDRLSNMVRNWIDPLPVFNVETWTAEDGKSVVALIVEKGSQPAYGAGTTPDELRYYIRRGGTTFVAAPEQVRQLARSTPAIEQNPSFASHLGYNVFGQ